MLKARFPHVCIAPRFVRQTAEVENHMTALERLVEYTSLPQEPADVDQGGAAPPKGWPASGTLQYDRVTAVYRPGLPPVLQDVSFELQVGAWGGAGDGWTHCGCYDCAFWRHTREQAGNKTITSQILYVPMCELQQAMRPRLLLGCMLVNNIC